MPRIRYNKGPVDKSKNSAEIHSNLSRIINLEIEKDGISLKIELPILRNAPTCQVMRYPASRGVFLLLLRKLRLLAMAVHEVGGGGGREHRRAAQVGRLAPAVGRGLGQDDLVKGVLGAVGLRLPQGRGLGCGDIARADAVGRAGDQRDFSIQRKGIPN